MGFFDKKTKTQEGSTITTSGFYIGSSEAEAEVANAKITLDEVFEDYLGIIDELKYEKFIVSGRKGTGKSAIGAAIKHEADDNSNAFCTFIRKGDIDIEKIVQVAKEADIEIQNQLLFKWVILTKLLCLISENQNIQNLKEYEHLSKFIERNRGFIDIKNHEIVETIKENGFKINLEYFKRLVAAVCNKDIKIKEQKPEFYKLLPNLQDVIIKLLEKDPDNKYVIIFDDLDIEFSSKSESNIKNLTDLIRIAKEFNNDIFGKYGGCVKIILLLRDDIYKHLLYFADTAKMFGSYEVVIKWYEDIYKNNESKIKLKQFVENRLRKNFERIKIPIKSNNVWASFIDETGFNDYSYNSKTSFKYLIDHTFYRPRDIILLFNDIGKMNYHLPLSKNDLNELIGNYSQKIIAELRNELSIIFSKSEISSIFKVLTDLSKPQYPSFSYDEIENALSEQNLSDVSHVIETLFDYSLIGNQDNENNVTFKYREKGIDVYSVDKTQNFIPHYILKVYFKAK